MRVPNKIHINNYLIGGDLKPWNGERAEIFSVIKNDNNLPTLLGSIPSLDENTAIAAIEKADIAYNRGRGEWPTMSVQKRIKCVQRFVIEMEKFRDEISNLIMWEICKSKRCICRI